MPERIQRRRTKGWRMPEGAIYVGRPSKWGNPFQLGTRSALARVPALDGSAWEYEGRISANGARHDCYHPDGHVTEHHVRYMTRIECVDLYRQVLVTPTPQLSLTQRVRRPDPSRHLGRNHFDVVTLTVEMAAAELAGRDLVCWCPLTEPCHVDVLLQIANEVAA